MANRPANPQLAMTAMLDTIFTPSWIAAHPELATMMLQREQIPVYAQRLHYLASEGHDRRT